MPPPISAINATSSVEIWRWTHPARAALDGARARSFADANHDYSRKDFAHATTLARQLCSEKGMAIGSDGVQLLGGHGFVKEHPVERWYRDLRAAGVMEGALLV